MARTSDPELAGRRRRHEALYIDAHGNVTDDPAEAVRGEILEYDERGQPVRRTSFFLEEIRWLPVGEPAFLLWVLVFLLAVWFMIGLALGLL